MGEEMGRAIAGEFVGLLAMGRAAFPYSRSRSPAPTTCHKQGQVTISNDGATIMKLLDIVHPAAKSLVDVSLSQDAEVSAVY